MSSDPEDAHNISPPANTTRPVAVAIAKVGMMLFLAQWYYNHAQLQHETTEWVNLHAGSVLHPGQAQHLSSLLGTFFI